MVDVADLLKPYAEFIGYAVRGIPYRRHKDAKELSVMEGWYNYSYGKEPLRVFDYRRGGKEVWYCRPGNDKWRIRFNNIVATGIRDRKVRVKDVGEEKYVDSKKIKLLNWDGLKDISDTYKADFGKTKSQSDALTLGFSESVKAMLKIGNSTTPASASLETSVTASQEKAKTISNSESQNRTEETTVTAPPGYDMEFVGTRIRQNMEVTVTGSGILDFSIEIGEWLDNKKYHGWFGDVVFQGHNMRTHGYWASFEDFMTTIRGNGSRDQFFWEWFRNNPAPGWLMDRAHLNKPVDVPFKQTSRYDGTTKIELKPHIIRGPRLPEQKIIFGE